MCVQCATSISVYEKKKKKDHQFYDMERYVQHRTVNGNVALHSLKISYVYLYVYVDKIRMSEGLLNGLRFIKIFLSAA